MVFLIRIFPEIAIKSRPVRKQLTQRLCSNIGLALRDIDDSIKIKSLWDKIKITVDSDDKVVMNQIIIKLKKIVGIQDFSIVESHKFIDISSLFASITKIYQNKINDKSFAVRVKRNGDHSFTSLDIEKEIGSMLLKEFPSAFVRLKNPDITVRIEIKDDHYFLHKQKYDGINGYPVGSQEKVLSLISGGFDSSVASFLMMQKGCKVDYLFFNLGGYAHEMGVKEVSKYLCKNFSTGYSSSFISINFENIITELMEKIQPKYRGIVLKRCMYRAAETLSKELNYRAVVTGESLGQVSSQTLTNLNVINQVTNQLVIQPLITMNKLDIIKIAQNIGTEEFAIQMPEYCGVVSQKPSTGAKLESVLYEEKRFNISILNQVIEKKEMIKINQFQIENSDQLKIETTNNIKPADIVIDVREPEKIELNPLKSEQKIEIPFYKLNSKFSSLDQKKTYLLYCENGTTSKLLALNLVDKGYTNVKVLSA